MPQDIRNETELRGEFGKRIEEVLKAVSGKISEKLQRQIERDVYTTENTWYNRTGEFERAWKWKEIKKTISSMTRELYYDSDSVKWNGKWVHGNPGREASSNLEDILNLAWGNYPSSGYTSSMLWRSGEDKHFSHKRRPYWDNFIKDLFDGGELERLFEEEFSNVGLMVQRV